MSNRKPKRRWLQFSMRSVLLLTLAVALWLGYEVRQAQQVERTITALRALGGDAEYEASDWSLLRLCRVAGYGRRIVRVTVPGVAAGPGSIDWHRSTPVGAARLQPLHARARLEELGGLGFRQPHAFASQTTCVVRVAGDWVLTMKGRSHVTWAFRDRWRLRLRFARLEYRWLPASCPDGRPEPAGQCAPRQSLGARWRWRLS